MKLAMPFPATPSTVPAGASTTVSAAGPASAIESTSRETVTVTQHAVASVLVMESADPTDDEIESIRLSSTSVVAGRGESLVLSAEAFGAGDTALDGVEFVWAMADRRAGAITRHGEFVAGESPGVYGDAISVTFPFLDDFIVNPKCYNPKPTTRCRKRHL